jgi:hypothetical protein
VRKCGGGVQLLVTLLGVATMTAAIIMLFYNQ